MYMIVKVSLLMINFLLIILKFIVKIMKNLLNLNTVGFINYIKILKKI